MRWFGPAAIGCLVGGVASLAAAVATNGAEIHLILIIPVVTGNSPLALLGIILIMAAIFLGFLAIAARQMDRVSDSLDEDPDISFSGPLPPAGKGATGSARSAPSAGGVVFLGPFPVVFGSNQKVAKWMLVVAAVIVIVLVAVYVALFTGLLKLP
jgi:uncharacterized protein (TIGR00304 family)